jgi:hypothetical protein
MKQKHTYYGIAPQLRTSGVQGTGFFRSVPSGTRSFVQIVEIFFDICDGEEVYRFSSVVWRLWLRRNTHVLAKMEATQGIENEWFSEPPNCIKETIVAEQDLYSGLIVLSSF